MITYEDIRKNEAINTYIKKADESLKALGYTAVIVEGNPMNYRSRGFVTSAPFGITAHESVELPATECLMVKELIPGGLEGIHQIHADDGTQHARTEGSKGKQGDLLSG